MKTAPAIVDQFFSRKTQKIFQKGDIILRPSPTLDEVIYLESGQVIQYVLDESGNKSILNIYKPGAFFPMSSALNGTPNRFFFEASQQSEGRIATAKEAVELLESSPVVTLDLLSRLYRGVDGLLGRTSLLIKGTARERLLYELGILGERFGEKTSDGVIVRITEEELGNQVGLTRETVSRALTELAKDKLLVRAGKARLLLKPLDETLIQ